MAVGAAQPIQRANTYQLVAEQLIQEIVENDLTVGDPVPTERELAERYGVGRSSVRESLRLLEAHRVIRPAQKGNYVVGSRGSVLASGLQMLVALGSTSLEELHDLRRVLEVEAVLRAVRFATEEDIANLRLALQEMIANRNDQVEALRMDIAFHVAIAEAAKNGALLATVEGLRGALEQKILGADFDIDEAIAQHQLILEAIIARDGERARECIENHMNFVHEGFKDEK